MVGKYILSGGEDREQRRSVLRRLSGNAVWLAGRAGGRRAACFAVFDRFLVYFPLAP